jgi:energy-coupling factor transporter ATP-binding protein EcfA2
VTSLLEVGTGFHPDLSGEENIFLNGAILGMTRAEIKKRFAQIVAFAEIERFLQTPVKHYSSGMYVRLAFAVAAHLEPEILIVDEVLAVGDVEFQRKCLGKMQDVSALQGRTVLFVSHNMAAVTALCPRAVYLKNGNLMMIGATDEVLSAYLQSGRGAIYENVPDSPLITSGSTAIRKAWIESPLRRGAALNTLKPGEKFTLNIELCLPSHQSIELIVSFHDQLRRPLWTSTNSVLMKNSIPAGTRMLVKQHYLLPGLTIPGLTIDLATADAAKYPFLDHVIGAMTLPIEQLKGSDYKTQNTNFPLLVEPEQEVFALDS